MLTVTEAQALILKEARSFGTEKIPLEKSFGRVLAEDVRTDRDYPPFNRSAMDGYAIRAEEYAAAKKFALAETIYAGSPLSTKKYAAGSAVKIMTGAAVPAALDCVIRREDALVEGELVGFNAESAQRWKNISRQGEDLKKNEVLSVRGGIIDNATASLLASLGIIRPQVAKLPSVAMISTGNEIIPPAKKPSPVEIRNSNAIALRSQLMQYGIARVAHAHVADDQRKLAAAVAKHGKADILLMTGGVSAGDSDHVPDVLTELRFRKIFHKVQMKPGKPLWFGRRGKTVVFAIPGNPLSAQVIFRIFVESYLRKCLGLKGADSMALPLSEGRRKKDTLDTFFPVKVETGANSLSTLVQLPFNGSGDIRAALFSDGLAVQPAGQPELAAGTVVDFYPWRSW